MTDNTIGGALSSIKEFLEKIADNPEDLEKVLFDTEKKVEAGGLYQNIISAGHKEWTATYGRPWNLP